MAIKTNPPSASITPPSMSHSAENLKAKPFHASHESLHSHSGIPLFAHDEIGPEKPLPIGIRAPQNDTPEAINTPTAIIPYPNIGDRVSTGIALKLAKQMGLDYIANRLESRPQQYKSWTADGMSMLPDKIVGYLTGTDWRDLTNKCALPHDLGYAYGKQGDSAERKRVDTKFYHDLVNEAGMNKYVAAIFYVGVRLGGAEFMGLSFSWGFGRKNDA